MLRVHKTHDEWLVMRGNTAICRCDFKEDAQFVVDAEADKERLEWLANNGWVIRFSKKDWRDAIDEAMRGE